jgi:hypothetical protein
MNPTAEMSTKGVADGDAEKRRWMQFCFALASVVWTVGVAWGFALLLNYATTPGLPGPAVATWPKDSGLAFDSTRPNLVLLVHPQCPCTSATIDEFERLVARFQGQAAATVAVYRPANTPLHWAMTEHWRRASAVPGVAVHFDEDGVAANRFGVNTSGHLVLYHRDGRRLFSGGITNARGHAGGSFGTEAVRALLTTGVAETTETPVYGCPIATPLSPMNQGAKKCCK